jgi:hypothetical protein
MIVFIVRSEPKEYEWNWGDFITQLVEFLLRSWIDSR